MCARALQVLFVLAILGGVSAQSITVAPGDTLWSLAQQHGVSVEALQDANGLEGASLRPGDTLTLPQDAASPTPEAAHTYEVQPGDALYAIAQEAGVTVKELMAWNDLGDTTINPGRTLTLRPPDEAPVPLEVTVSAGDTLWDLATAHGTDPATLAAANDLPETAMLHPGDRLTIPGAYASAEGGDLGGPASPTITVDPGDSLWEIARRYNTTVDALMEGNELSSASLMAGQELVIVGGDRVSAAAAPEPSPSPSQAGAANAMVWPLDGAITSRFGQRGLRINGSNAHYGLDIDGDTGDPIRAAVGGTVAFAGWLGGFGKLVIVEHDDTEYYYAHASALLVSEGESVAAGDTVARVGTTGRVTGSHLHFEIRVAGTPVDPLPLLQARAQR